MFVDGCGWTSTRHDPNRAWRHLDSGGVSLKPGPATSYSSNRETAEDFTCRSLPCLSPSCHHVRLLTSCSPTPNRHTPRPRHGRLSLFMRGTSDILRAFMSVGVLTKRPQPPFAAISRTRSPARSADRPTQISRRYARAATMDVQSLNAALMRRHHIRSTTVVT